MSLTKVTYSMIAGSARNVLDYGAVGDGVTDDTAAFVAAQGTGNVSIVVPTGTYLVDDLRIRSGVTMIGQGRKNTIFKQKEAANPAINATSDASVGQLLGVTLSGFSVTGHASASVAAVKFYATGVYAIFDSTFDFSVNSAYGAATIEGPSANNIFYCKFAIQGNGFSGPAVYFNGGTYNEFDFFLTQCAVQAVYGNDGFDNTFTRLIADGTVRLGGQNTTLISPKIENIFGVATYTAALNFYGFSQVCINPTINMDAPSAAKLTYAFAPGYGTTLINPNIIGFGSIANPIANTAAGNYPLTVVGPARSNCTNKMDTVWDGSDNTKNLRNVAFVGDVSTLTDQMPTHAGKIIQYLAPAGNFNLTVRNNIDAIILEPTGTIAAGNISIDPPYTSSTGLFDGRTLSITTSQTITTLTATTTTGADVTAFPATLSAGATRSFIYRKSNNKWYSLA